MKAFASNGRYWLLGLMTIGALVTTFWLPPIPQDPAYHEFADGRTFFGIPNFWNLISNLSFVLVGLFGLSRWSRLRPGVWRMAYTVFCIGAVLIGFGSAYYHFAPSARGLVWDRLPMTVAFMAFFSLVVHDRISEKLGRVIFWPLIFAGLSSVGYWYWTECQGQGDLRLYALVQFLPLLLIPFILLLWNGNGLAAAWIWATLGTYSLAKAVEHFDESILVATGVVSGHSIKHVLAALAMLWIVLAVERNRHGRPSEKYQGR